MLQFIFGLLAALFGGNVPTPQEDRYGRIRCQGCGQIRYSDQGCKTPGFPFR